MQRCQKESYLADKFWKDRVELALENESDSTVICSSVPTKAASGFTSKTSVRCLIFGG